MHCTKIICRSKSIFLSLIFYEMYSFNFMRYFLSTFINTFGITRVCYVVFFIRHVSVYVIFTLTNMCFHDIAEHFIFILEMFALLLKDVRINILSRYHSSYKVYRTSQLSGYGELLSQLAYFYLLMIDCSISLTRELLLRFMFICVAIISAL